MGRDLRFTATSVADRSFVTIETLEQRAGSETVMLFSCNDEILIDPEDIPRAAGGMVYAHKAPRAAKYEQLWTRVHDRSAIRETRRAESAG